MAEWEKNSTFAPANVKGAIAQLVEQRTENPCVPGSIPGGTTIKDSRIVTYTAIFLKADQFIGVIRMLVCKI